MKYFRDVLMILLYLVFLSRSSAAKNNLRGTDDDLPRTAKDYDHDTYRRQIRVHETARGLQIVEICSTACSEHHEEVIDGQNKTSSRSREEVLPFLQHPIGTTGSSRDFTRPFNPDANNPKGKTRRDLTKHRPTTNKDNNNNNNNDIDQNDQKQKAADQRDLSIVGDNDERRPSRGTSYPQRTVGLVERVDGYTCSGTLVGPNLMLTAKHCIQWTRNGFLDMTFTPAYYPGNTPPFGTAQAKPNQIYRVQSIADEGTYNAVAYDWVLIVLDWDIGYEVGWMGVTTFQSSWLNMRVWDHIGYPVDHGSRPIFFGGGSVKEITSEFDDGTALVLESDVDTIDGQSGGPLYSRFGEKEWYLVAVCSANDGNDSDDYNYWAGGSNLEFLVSWARERQI